MPLRKRTTAKNPENSTTLRQVSPPNTENTHSPLANILHRLNIAPKSVSSQEFSLLQRTIGNHAVSQLLGKSTEPNSGAASPLQRKPQISIAGRTSALTIQRHNFKTTVAATGYTEDQVRAIYKAPNPIPYDDIVNFHTAGMSHADMLAIKNRGVRLTLFRVLVAKGWLTNAVVGNLLAAENNQTLLEPLVTAGLTPQRFQVFIAAGVTLAQVRTYRGYGYRMSYLEQIVQPGYANGLTQQQLDALIAANYGTTQPEAALIMANEAHLRTLINGGMTNQTLITYLNLGFTPAHLAQIVNTFTAQQAAALLNIAAPPVGYLAWLIANAAHITPLLAANIGNAAMIQQMAAYGFNAQQIQDVQLFEEENPGIHNDSYLKSHGIGIEFRLGHFARRHTYKYFDFNLAEAQNSLWPPGSDVNTIDNYWRQAYQVKANGGWAAAGGAHQYDVTFNGFTALIGFNNAETTMNQFYPSAGPGIRTYTLAQINQFRQVMALHQ